MEKISLREVISAVHGEVLNGFTDLDRTVIAINTDSRAIDVGGLFVPLVGDRFDGHSYLENALTAGAAACLTQHSLARYHDDHCYIKVEDTERALGDLARWYKRRFDIPCVAITGSVGKTTTKDMVAAVLSTKYNVLKTEGNFNNNIGLPLTIFRLDSTHDICVLEMGMDTAGEIDYLASIATPEIAIITNVGDAHIERLGSRENIFKAKCELLPHVKKDGLLVLNGDDELLNTIAGTTPQPIAYFGGNEGLEYHATQVNTDGVNHISFTVKAPKMERLVELPAIGNYMIYPTLTAVAVGERLGLTADEIVDGIRSFVPTRMRMNIHRCGDAITILDDSYNANPQSMRAAIQVLSDSGTGRTVAVLGDMFELGSFSEGLHSGVGKAVADGEIDVLVAVGEKAKFIAEGAEQGDTIVHHFATKEEAKEMLTALMGHDTTFLVKASRGMAMEELTAHLLDCAPKRAD